MQWSATITGRSEIQANETVEISFDISGGGSVLAKNIQITGVPSDIEALISARVTSFAQQYEVLQAIPGIGEEIIFIANGS